MKTELPRDWIVMSDTRIGRLRYIVYSVGFGLCCLPGLWLADALTSQGHATGGMVLTLVTQAIVCALNIMLTVRRLHDFGARGWWAVLQIPLAFYDPQWIAGSPITFLRLYLAIALGLVLMIYVLILLLRPGTPGANRFGGEPAPNTPWIIAGAYIGVIVPVVGYIVLLIVQSVLSSPVSG